jgi:predicted enzyme related to lactoylglutathione lyase
MNPTPSPIAAVMIHVADVELALRWYQRALPEAERVSIGSPAFECLSLHGVLIEIVPQDEKVGAGAFGSVVYWRVDDFDAALLRVRSLGGTLYRGPLRIGDSQCMCQVQDPWGNCIGLRGPSAELGPAV